MNSINGKRPDELLDVRGLLVAMVVMLGHGWVDPIYRGDSGTERRGDVARVSPETIPADENPATSLRWLSAHAPPLAKVAWTGSAPARVSSDEAPDTDLRVDFAQAVDDELAIIFSIYLWGPNLSGDIVVDGLSVPVDANLGEVLSDLRGVFFTHLEVRPGPWIFFADLMYADLGGDATLPLGGTLDVDFKQVNVVLAMGYQIGAWPLGEGEFPKLGCEVIGGAQYTHLNVDVSITGLIPVQEQGSTGWVDPFIGGRLGLHLSEHWSIAQSGNVGGFGIGSSSTLMWDVVGAVNWSINDWFSLLLGYRALDYDYDYGSGSGSDRFEYDMTMHGPFLAVAFKF